jgi:hypothetical protein
MKTPGSPEFTKNLPLHLAGAQYGRACSATVLPSMSQFARQARTLHTHQTNPPPLLGRALKTWVRQCLLLNSALQPPQPKVDGLPMTHRSTVVMRQEERKLQT